MLHQGTTYLVNVFLRAGSFSALTFAHMEVSTLVSTHIYFVRLYAMNISAYKHGHTFTSVAREQND